MKLNLFTRRNHITKFRFRQPLLLFHQRGVLRVLDERDEAADARFAVHKPPGETANRRALVEQEINVAARTFEVDDVVWKHFDVHQLVLVRREHFRHRFAVLFLEMRVRFFGLARHPGANDRVHRMIGAAAVHADPLDLFALRPFGELAVGPGMLDHVPNFVGKRLIPAVAMIAGVDDENVPFAHLDALFDHLGRVDVVIARDVGEVNDDAGTDEEIVEVERGDVFAGSEKVNLAVKVRAEVVRMRDELSVRAVRRKPLEILDLQGLVRGPRRCGNAERDGEVNQFHLESSLEVGYLAKYLADERLEHIFCILQLKGLRLCRSE